MFTFLHVTSASHQYWIVEVWCLVYLASQLTNCFCITSLVISIYVVIYLGRCFLQWTYSVCKCLQPAVELVFGLFITLLLYFPGYKPYRI